LIKINSTKDNKQTETTRNNDNINDDIVLLSADNLSALDLYKILKQYIYGNGEARNRSMPL